MRIPDSGLAPLPRRVFLTVTAASLLAARDARAEPPELTKLLAGRTPREGGIRLDIPEIAENGQVVPLNVEAESPMTEADHVSAIHVFAEGNPNPLVASFYFTLASGRAAASTRMRLAQTQDVVVLAETAAGEVRMARAQIKVTIGGCGG